MAGKCSGDSVPPAPLIGDKKVAAPAQILGAAGLGGPVAGEDHPHQVQRPLLGGHGRRGLAAREVHGGVDQGSVPVAGVVLIGEELDSPGSVRVGGPRTGCGPIRLLDANITRVAGEIIGNRGTPSVSSLAEPSGSGGFEGLRLPGQGSPEVSSRCIQPLDPQSRI